MKMDKMLNTGKVTKRLEAKFLDRKAYSIDHYVNFLDWLRFMKDETELVKFQEMMVSMLKNWLIKPKEKAELFCFLYSQFKKKAEELSESRKTKFECMSAMDLIWGYEK